MKKICFVFLLAVMTFLSCRKEIEKPTVQTKEVDKVAETSAVVRGSVSDDGGSEVTSRGFCYGETSNPTIEDGLTAGSGSGVGGFERTIENLEPNTAYYVRAYAINEAGVSYGEEKTFTTLKETPEQPEDPVVMTSDVTEIAVATAICGGEVVDGGNAVVVARGVCWSVISNPTVSDEYTVDGNGEGVFTSNISGLEHNTIYYVRAYATNANGVTSYGDEKTFTTLEKQLPVISTAEVENITSYSAVSGGNVTFDGNVAVTARGVCWSTSSNPTINDDKTVDGSGTGVFTSNLVNLTDNTTYYVRAYATNEMGTSYGDEKTFTTLEKQLPVISTAEVENITAYSAVSGGNVAFDGNVAVTARGVCWSTSSNPTIGDNKTIDGTGSGPFVSTFIDLEPNTTYYVRAYATNEMGTSYGDEKSFTTRTLTGTINGYNWVDLGLPSGLRWATCNVGANTPEDYGNYYAWGETTTKSAYTEDNSQTYGLGISELQAQGIIDGNNNLTSSHDAATVNWGGTWRMPTETEMQELIDNCTWEWLTQNGVNGCKFTGTNGNSIFLPAAGYRGGSSLNGAGGCGKWWSSTPYDYDDYLAFDFGFNSLDKYSFGYRYYGYTVRPVTE